VGASWGSWLVVGGGEGTGERVEREQEKPG